MTRARFFSLAALITLAALAGCRSAHTTSAILYIDEQRYDKAVAVIQEGFQFQDDEADAFYWLGEAYSHIAEDAVVDDEYVLAKENYTLAYEAYMRALEIDRRHFEEEVATSLRYNYNNRVNQARRDWDDEYYEQAEGHLRLAYAALPDSVTPVKNIARMKMQMASEDAFSSQREDLLLEAMALLDQVLGQNPEAYELKLDKANVLAALGRNAEANTIYTALLAEHGDDTVLLLEIASLAVNDGDYARAADFYVRVVDLYEADTDATNDDQNQDMLVAAGTWYSLAGVGRYEDSIAVLERAANIELLPSANLMLQRVRTYYSFGKKLKDDGAAETDPALQAELKTRSTAMFERAVEIGIAMTDNFPTNADGFFYLGNAQVELGQLDAAQTNFKTYEELNAAVSP